MEITAFNETHLPSCSPDQTLEEAARIMWETSRGTVPVTDNHRKVIGIITDREACMAAYKMGRSLGEIPIREALDGQQPLCPLESINHIEQITRHHQLQRIPISNGDQLLGVIWL